MSDEGLSFGLTLEDRMSGPSKEMGKSLADLSSDMTKARAELTLYQSQLALSKDTGNIAGFRKYSAAVQEQKAKVFSLTEALSAMPNGAEAAAKSLDPLASITSHASEAIAGSTGKGLTSALEMFGMEATVATGGAVLVGAAILKLGAMAFEAAKGLAELAVQGAEMAIHATQGKQAMVSMFGALGGGAKIGKETEEMLGDLSERIGVTKDELAPFTKSFMAMGIEGTEALEKVTLAAASAQAIMGDPAAAHAFENLTKKIQVAVQTGQGLKIPAKGLGSLAEMGLKVDDVAKRMNISSAALAKQLKEGTVKAGEFGDALQGALVDKGAGPLQRMGSSLGNLKKMFGQSIEDMFEDMESAIGPFLKEVKSMLSIFSQSTASGRAMKAYIGGAFQFIFTQATKAVPYIKHFFLDLVIWSLKGYIFVKKHWTEIKSIMMAFGVVIGAIGVSFGVFAAMIVGPTLLVVAAVGSIIAGIGLLANALYDLISDAADAGANLVEGFVGGILGGWDSAKEAMAGLGKSALDGVKGVLGMKSPSKVMFQLGGFTAEPFAAGIDKGAARVQSAASGLGDAAVSGVSNGLRSTDYNLGGGDESKASGKGAGASISGITINIEAPSGVTHAVELTEIALATLFERLQLSQGL